ncbi:MAG: efflux RND transporter periplasmic adaptor subunit [Chloroflexota bacterium]
MRRTIIIVIILAVLGVGGYFGYNTFQARNETAVSETNVPDIVENDNSGLTIEGQIVPANFVELSFQVGGRVTNILVAEGDVVTAGTPLVELDNGDQQLALQRAEMGVEQAQAGIETAQVGLAQAQAALAMSEVGVKAAAAQLALLEADPTTEQLALNDSQVGLAEAAIVQAGGQLALTVEGTGSAQIAAAQAKLEAAQADLTPLQIQQDQVTRGDLDLSDEQENQLRLQIAAVLARIQAAETELAELRAGATPAERAAASGGVSSATASRDAAVAQQALFLAGTREEQLEVARIGLSQAETAVSEAQLQVALAEENVAQAEAAVAEAEQGVAAAQSALDKTVLVATLDGTVATLNLELGELVNPARPVVVIADLSTWHIETTDLTELGVVDVRVGQAIEVALDAFPGEMLSGEVIEIASNSTQSLGDVTYVVTIELNDAEDLALRWGMTSVANTEAASSGEATSASSVAVSAEGELVPAKSSNLAFQVNGLVAEVLVEEGETVSAGQPLVMLDSSDTQIQRDQAAARVNSAEIALRAAEAQLAIAQAKLDSAGQPVASAEANLALLTADPRPEEIEAAQKRLEAAQAGVVRAAGQRDTVLTAITQSQIESAQAQLAAAQAQFTAVSDGYQNILDACFTPPGADSEVCPLYGPVEEQTRARVSAAEAQVNAAHALVDQLTAGATSGQRQAASGGVAVSEAQVDLAQAQLDLLLADPLPEQVTIAEVGVEQAQAGIGLAEVGVLQAETAVRHAEIGLSMAQLELATRDLALEKLTLIAPYDGTITQLMIKEGQAAAPGMNVAVLADFSTWEIHTTDLTELDVANVAIGDSVAVAVDALPNANLSGTVEAIANRSRVSQGDVVYEVVIRPEDMADLPLRWGMTTFVEIN